MKTMKTNFIVSNLLHASRILTTCLVVIFALVTAESLLAQEGIYAVDGRANVVSPSSGDFTASGINVGVPTAGQLTFTLTQSNFRENAGNPNAQPHVLIHSNSNVDEFRTFSLNGVGDSVTIDAFKSTFYTVLFLDTLTSDNTGSSTVEITKDGQPFTTAVLDAQSNVFSPPSGQDFTLTAVNIPFPSAGNFLFRLLASDFKENAGNPRTQPHVVVHGNSDANEFRTFTLNGVGDEKILELDKSAFFSLFFLDTQTSDNLGGSVVEIVKLPELGPGLFGLLTISAMCLASGLGMRKQRRLDVC